MQESPISRFPISDPIPTSRGLLIPTISRRLVWASGVD